LSIGRVPEVVVAMAKGQRRQDPKDYIR
jgi:hypothetical protein